MAGMRRHKFSTSSKAFYFVWYSDVLSAQRVRNSDAMRVAGRARGQADGRAEETGQDLGRGVPGGRQREEARRLCPKRRCVDKPTVPFSSDGPQGLIKAQCVHRPKQCLTGIAWGLLRVL
eukprot:scaffold96074_cov29-Prasinocladus_malaysianus.AAC.2